MPTLPIPGLHHVTAIASDPQRNLDFYTQVLGLRFVKKTINFDDPGTYHFYFGDDLGTPGTILTFFPWPHAVRGTAGAGEVSHTAFSVPVGSLDFWEQRLSTLGLPVERGHRFDEDILTFADPDGMKIELVAHEEASAFHAPRFADVPVEHTVRGFFGVTLLERNARGTESALALLGFRKTAEEGNRLRFRAAGEALGNHIDVVVDPQAKHGRMGAGTVHHIAFRSANEEDQLAWMERINEQIASSPMMERDYFRSIYFREPGGVLFELATDTPGFAVDEPVESLGESLRVPEWMEPRATAATKRLVPVTLHKSTEVSE